MAGDTDLDPGGVNGFLAPGIELAAPLPYERGPIAAAPVCGVAAATPKRGGKANGPAFGAVYAIVSAERL